MLSLFKSATNLIRWDRMVDLATGLPVEDATVTATLRNSDLEPVSGAVGLAMAKVSGVSGRYQGAIPSTVDLVEGESYFLDIQATAAGVVGFVRVPCIVGYRGER